MKGIMITVKEHCNNLESLAKELSEQGANVKRIYPYGVIKAEAEESIIERLRSHRDIENISIEKSIHLPPPDDSVQ